MVPPIDRGLSVIHGGQDQSTSFTQDCNDSLIGLEVTINGSDVGDSSSEIDVWINESLASVDPATPVTDVDPNPTAAAEDPNTTIAAGVDSNHPIAVGDDPIAIEDPDPIFVKVHRTMIRQDLINVFFDDSIMSKPLIGIMINSRGEEKGCGTGVMSEIFTLFWSEFAYSSLIGEEERVPFIRHDYNR